MGIFNPCCHTDANSYRQFKSFGISARGNRLLHKQTQSAYCQGIFGLSNSTGRHDQTKTKKFPVSQWRISAYGISAICWDSGHTNSSVGNTRGSGNTGEPNYWYSIFNNYQLIIHCEYTFIAGKCEMNLDAINHATRNIIL